MLHIIYRSYGGENLKGRPHYYSKYLALASCVRAVGELPAGSAELIFLNDGSIPEPRISLMRSCGEIVQEERLGLKGSIRAANAIALSRGWGDNEVVWFAEDDYLYIPAAFTDLLDAVEAMPDVDYFGLYALIGSREASGLVFYDLPRVPPRWKSSGSEAPRHSNWRRALSTTSTFGVRVSALRRHHRMMNVAMLTGGAFDHSINLMAQGYAPYSTRSLVQNLVHGTGHVYKRLGAFFARCLLNAYHGLRMLGGAGRSVLMTADPAVITHLETAYLAQGTDWESAASSTREWLASFPPSADAGRLGPAAGLPCRDVVQ